MADPIFEHPRLAAIYDALDPDRSDLDVYVAIAEELGAHRVLDVGCGTGTFALLLADRATETPSVQAGWGAAALGLLLATALNPGFVPKFEFSTYGEGATAASVATNTESDRGRASERSPS